MSNTVSSSDGIAAIISAIDLGPSGSLQFQFSKLQLAMAELSKNGAMDYIKQIESSQKEQKEISIQARLDQVGTNTQQLMVFVQDFMGQYNSYLQGSNSVIQQANQTLAELAKAS